jgi:hypothetical protein
MRENGNKFLLGIKKPQFLKKLGFSMKVKSD